MHKLRRNSLLFFLSALLLGGCAGIPDEAEYAVAPTKQEYEGAVYETAEVTRTDIVQTATVNFKFQSSQTETLKFGISGENYGDFYVSVGDTVTAGQLIASLDVQAEKDEISALEESSADASLALQRNEENRSLELRAAAVYADSMDASAYALKIAEINERFDESAQELRDRITVADLKKQELEARVTAREITAPCDGVISYLYVPEDGEKSSDNKKIAILTSSMISAFAADTEYADDFETGAGYELISGGKSIDTTAESAEQLGIIPAEGEENMVYLVPDTSDYSFSDGNSGYVKLVLQEKKNVLSVPVRAINTINGESVVYVPDENGIRTYRKVELGIQSTRFAEILSGLSEGDEVILGEAD